MKTPELSVIIPVYNEEAGLRVLFDRLYPALDALELSYEVIFVNDGSRDRSAALLSEQFHARDDVTRRCWRALKHRAEKKSLRSTLIWKTRRKKLAKWLSRCARATTMSGRFARSGGAVYGGIRHRAS